MLSIDLTAIAQFCLFLFFLVSINAYLLKPLIRSIEERDRRIAGTRRDAERMARDAEEREKEFVTRMQAERERAVARRDELREEGRALERELLEKARSSVAEKVQAAFGELKEKRGTEWKQLQGQATGMASLITSKVLGREVG